mgnify:CR=1 FL=1
MLSTRRLCCCPVAAAISRPRRHSRWTRSCPPPHRLSRPSQRRTRPWWAAGEGGVWVCVCRELGEDGAGAMLPSGTRARGSGSIEAAQAYAQLTCQSTRAPLTVGAHAAACGARLLRALAHACARSAPLPNTRQHGLQLVVQLPRRRFKHSKARSRDHGHKPFQRSGPSRRARLREASRSGPCIQPIVLSAATTTSSPGFGESRSLVPTSFITTGSGSGAGSSTGAGASAASSTAGAGSAGASASAGCSTAAGSSAAGVGSSAASALL